MGAKQCGVFTQISEGGSHAPFVDLKNEDVDYEELYFFCPMPAAGSRWVPPGGSASGLPHRSQC